MADYWLTAKYGLQKMFLTALFSKEQIPGKNDVEELLDPSIESALYEREWYSDWTVSMSNGGEYIPCKLFANEVEIDLNKAQTQPFLMQYGLVQFKVVMSRENGTDLVLYSKYCSALNSIDSSNIEQMILRIVNIKEPVLSMLQWPSKTPGKNEAQNCTEEKKYSMLTGFTSRLESGTGRPTALHGIIETYNKHSGFFHAKPEYTIRKQPVPVPFHRVRVLSRDSMIWSARTGNMQRLPKQYSGGIQIGNDCYMPCETLTETAKKDYHIYENQVIVGFLDTVCRQLNESEWIEEKSWIGNGFDVLRMILYPENTRVAENRAEIENIRRRYQHSLRLEERKIPKVLSVPTQTKRFQEIPPYREIYQKIYEWFRGKNSWGLGDGAIFKGLLADKIYEYFCWQELLRLFAQKGFEKERASIRTDYNKNRIMPPFANIVFLKKGNVRITLYFDPWLPICKNGVAAQYGISLVRTELSSVGRLGDGYSPDFLIKVESGNNTEYAIVDAKFRDMKRLFAKNKPLDSTVCAMEEALQKYYINLSDNKQLRRPVKMVWLFQGRIEPFEENLGRLSRQVIGKGDPEASLDYYPDSFFDGLSWGAISLNSQNNSEWGQAFWNEFERNMLRFS